MRTLVILQHVLISEGSLAHAASEDLIFAVLRRFGTDGRTDPISTLRRSLRFQFGGFPFRGATSPDDSIVVIARHIVVVAIVVIVIIIVVNIVITSGRGFRVGARRHFSGRRANG